MRQNPFNSTYAYGHLENYDMEKFYYHQALDVFAKAFKKTAFSKYNLKFLIKTHFQLFTDHLY